MREKRALQRLCRRTGSGSGMAISPVGALPEAPGTQQYIPLKGSVNSQLLRIRRTFSLHLTLTARAIRESPLRRGTGTNNSVPDRFPLLFPRPLAIIKVPHKFITTMRNVRDVFCLSAKIHSPFSHPSQQGRNLCGNRWSMYFSAHGSGHALFDDRQRTGGSCR